MKNRAITVFEQARQRIHGDRAALALTVETLFKRYTTKGRHLPDGSLKTELYLEHVRQTGRYIAKFFGRPTRERADTGSNSRLRGVATGWGCWRSSGQTQYHSTRPGDVQSRAQLGVSEI